MSVQDKRDQELAAIEDGTDTVLADDGAHTAVPSEDERLSSEEERIDGSEITKLGRRALGGATETESSHRRQMGVRQQGAALAEMVGGPDLVQLSDVDWTRSVGQIATIPVRTIRADAPAQDAVDLLRGQQLRHLPVVRASGELCGMMSESQLPERAELRAATEELAMSELTVAELMAPVRAAVNVEEDLTRAADLMLEHRIVALPVVEPTTQEVVGLLSASALLRVERDSDA